MTSRRKAFVAIVDDDDDIDHITSYCERCKDFGFYHLLGPRMYPKDEPIPYDADKWLQCPNCGQVTPRVHARHENEIEGIKSVPDNIHDSNKVAIATTYRKDSSHARSRAIIDQIKRTRPGANRRNNYIDVDSDLRNQLSKGKTLVSYSSTNDELDKDK